MKAAPEDDGRAHRTEQPAAERRQRRRGPIKADGSGAHAVMFVCAANVCRSPLMAYAFDAAVRVRAAGEWNVSSGGVSAREPLPICVVAASVLRDHGVSADLFSSHEAARLTVDYLDRQDIIITASKEERGLIAMMRPGLRARTFTLNEAVALGAAMPTAMEIDASTSAVGSDGGQLARYASILNLRRGTMIVHAPATPRRGQRLRRVEPDPHDIPDVHHLRKRAHLSTLTGAWQSTQQLQSHMRAFLQADPGAEYSAGSSTEKP